MQFARMDGGGVPVVKVLPSAASKTWVQGYLANFESGALDNYTTNDTAIAGMVVSNVASSTAAGYDVEVIVPTENTIFEAYYYSTAANFASTNIGSRYKLYPGSLNKISTTGISTGAAPLILVGYDNTQKKALVKIAADKCSVLSGR